MQAGAQGIVSNNIISDCGNNGTITSAVSIFAYSSAVGNRLAVPATYGLAGGATGKTFVDNLDARATAGTDIWNLET